MAIGAGHGDMNRPRYGHAVRYLLIVIGRRQRRCSLEYSLTSPPASRVRPRIGQPIPAADQSQRTPQNLSLVSICRRYCNYL